MAYCDLHTHSTYSDGTDTIPELIAGAEKAGLAAIALCDHNTIAGLDEFLRVGAASPVETIPGTEFSTEYGEKELHILGLFIQPQHYGAVAALLRTALEGKERSNRALVEALKGVGIVLDYDSLKARSKGVVNRALVAEEMMRLGYCESIREAFDKYLHISHGFYTPAKRPDAFETIRFIKSIGAVAVLAHPFLDLTQEQLRQFLPEAREAGLDGMEVYYGRYDEETTALAASIAEEYGILPSGGSDYHGRIKPDISIGIGRGNLAVPMECLENLRKRKKDIFPEKN